MVEKMMVSHFTQVLEERWSNFVLTCSLINDKKLQAYQLQTKFKRKKCLKSLWLRSLFSSTIFTSVHLFLISSSFMYSILLYPVSCKVYGWGLFSLLTNHFYPALPYPLLSCTPSSSILLYPPLSCIVYPVCWIIFPLSCSVRPSQLCCCVSVFFISILIAYFVLAASGNGLFSRY